MKSLTLSCPSSWELFGRVSLLLLFLCTYQSYVRREVRWLDRIVHFTLLLLRNIGTISARDHNCSLAQLTAQNGREVGRIQRTEEGDSFCQWPNLLLPVPFILTNSSNENGRKSCLFQKFPFSLKLGAFSNDRKLIVVWTHLIQRNIFLSILQYYFLRGNIVKVIEGYFQYASCIWSIGDTPIDYCCWLISSSVSISFDMSRCLNTGQWNKSWKIFLAQWRTLNLVSCEERWFKRKWLKVPVSGSDARFWYNATSWLTLGLWTDWVRTRWRTTVTAFRIIAAKHHY